MELVLYRTYNPLGTNGDLYIHGVFICHTIELPWLNNEQRRSCIPEGKYELKKRYSQRFGDHLLVNNVINRSLILIHPANNAIKELRSCIAPVTYLTGKGRGKFSRIAMTILMDLLDDQWKQTKVTLRVTSKEKSMNNCVEEH